jgi:hypothetical protein
MRSLNAAALAALQQRAVTMRDFLWLHARDRSTNAIIKVGYWSDLGTVAAQVLNPDTGLVDTRNFDGAGALIEISAIPMVANLTVQSVTVRASQISDANDLVRAYDVRQQRIEIYRGLFATGTLNQIAPAYARFVGFVDDIEITTPAEGGDGGVVLTCMSHLQEMSRTNPATRSDAYLKQRATTDTFRRHTATVGTWELKWGTAS